MERDAPKSQSSKQQSKQQSTPQEVLQGERTLRHFTQQVLDCRQTELQLAETQNKRLLRRLDQTSKETTEVKVQLLETRKQLKAREQDLQNASGHILRLQSRREDMTESEARETYKALCDGVQRWVEDRLPAAMQSLTLGRVQKPPASHAARFLSLLRDPGKRCLSVRHGDAYQVAAAIMYFLWLVFFSKPFYCPLDDSDDDAVASWMASLESPMAKFRDVERCREWRSDTLKAICLQKSFTSRRHSYVLQASKDLSSLLTAVLPGSSVLELQGSLWKSVVKPAADLAHQLHTSVNFFWLKWPLKTASSRLEVYECANVADGGRVIDVSATSAASRGRQDVQYLFDIAPGLFVQQVQGEKKMALRAICRPKVLVHAGEGRVSHEATLLTRLHSASLGCCQE